ncbi:nuclease [Sulfolobus sp. E5-1-F]|uniref:DNA double-strand break repair nuclease NurA n=1 Tax=Sulfolobaceae TaxID=118883 RepID=UPI0012955532|nr:MULTISPECIES: DNA double-strand break repair nuclease NurA [unclassified Sulfolobus]QGA53368.1 nuclease [Sulfolobus sp. E5-1-F]QGA68473.1 nuclease [Sulfolobus sp. E11-6]
MNIDEVIKKINELAIKDIDEKEKINTATNLIFDDITSNNTELKIGLLDEIIDSDHIACAVDGSKYEIELSDVTLILARAVKILGKKKDKKNVPSDIAEDFKIIENYYDKNVISNKSILFMLTLETGLIEKCEECDVIFIDGPIVDPPTYYEEDVEIENILSLDKLALYRSTVLRRLKDKNKLIVGIVKNFSHRILIKEFLNSYPALIKARENYIISNIIYKYRLERSELNKPIFLGWISWDSLINNQTIPDDLKGISKAYIQYKKAFKDSLSIYSIYYQYNITSPIVRIDVLTEKELDLTPIKYLNTWAMQGVREVTLLNKLADELSEINSQDAKKYALLFNLARENYLDINDKLAELMMRKT